MVSAVSQATAPTSESVPSDSTETRHWLQGRYFVPMPDLCDEVRWEISQGRAWPVFNGLIVLLHDLERRGTEPQRAAAVAGRIEHLGVNGLAESIRMSPSAVLRQLRFLERIGVVRTSQETFTTETDTVTGRIVRNYAKAPPKVVELTLTDRHFRPTGRTKGSTHETRPRRQGDTHETRPRATNPRDRNECVPRERTSKEVRSSGTNRRQDASGPLGRPETPAAKANPAGSGSRRHDVSGDVSRLHAAFDTDPGAVAKYLGLDPDDVASTPPGERRDELIRRFYARQGWSYDPATKSVSKSLCSRDHFSRLVESGEIKPAESPDDRASRQRLLAAYVANCAKSLRITEAEVVAIGKADKADLVRRLQDAGCDPATGRRIRHRVTDVERALEMQRRLDEQTGLDVRQATTAAVSLHSEPQEAGDAFGAVDDTLAREEAADGLREALETMSPTGRERARDLGEQIDEQHDRIDEEADALLKVIEQRRAADLAAQADSDRQCVELQEEVERQDRQFKELAQRLGVGKLRCES